MGICVRLKHGKLDATLKNKDYHLAEDFKRNRSNLLIVELLNFHQQHVDDANQACNDCVNRSCINMGQKFPLKIVFQIKLISPRLIHY